MHPCRLLSVTPAEMWGPDGKLHDVKCVIPDTCYSEWYQECIDFCQKNGPV